MINIFLKVCTFNLIKSFLSSSRNLSLSEAATILRPFYFAVHPDLFCQHPYEKEVNENSLKSLKAYLEENCHSENFFKSQNKTTNLTFYLRRIQNGKQQSVHNGSFQKLTFDLFQNDVPSTVTEILRTSDLSTEHVEKLKSNNRNIKSNNHRSQNHRFSKPTNDFPFNRIQFAQRKIYAENKKSYNSTLRAWLLKNMENSYHYLLKTNPIREEISRIQYDITNKIRVKDIIWDCSYGLSHRRGCLQSFQNLINQHPVVANVLNGKIVVFSTQNGVTLDGKVILNIEDVRQKWLDVIKTIPFYDDRTKLFPAIEKDISINFNGIKIGRRNFQSSVSVGNYEKCLKKMVSVLKGHKQRYPDSKLPNDLKEFELVIECESGPLTLSPTGQIIAPCTCPAFLLLNFINRNLAEAKYRMEHYNLIKNKELCVTQNCKELFKLAALKKDNSITPSNMVDCCERILRHFPDPAISLRGYRLIISNHYSVNQDGDMYIPWNWKI